MSSVQTLCHILLAVPIYWLIESDSLNGSWTYTIYIYIYINILVSEYNHQLIINQPGFSTHCSHVVVSSLWWQQSISCSSGQWKHGRGWWSKIRCWLVFSTLLKNMSSSVGMMTFPTEWKVTQNSMVPVTKKMQHAFCVACSGYDSLWGFISYPKS